MRNRIEALLEPPEYLAASVSNVWQQLVSDPGFVRAYLHGLGIWGIQEHLDREAVQHLMVPETTPTQRLRVTLPVILSEDARGTGDALVFRLRRDRPIQLGPQPQGSPFSPGRVYQLGEDLETGLVVYPIGEQNFDLLYTARKDPKATLLRGQDFELSERCIVFRPDLDPLELPGIVNEDGRAILWASYALEPTQWVREHLGIPVGVPDAPSRLKSYLVHVWRAYGEGLTAYRLRMALGALLGDPVAKADGTVFEVTPDAVITETKVYPVKNSTLNVGDTVKAGDSLTGTYQVFERVQDMEQLAADLGNIPLTVPLGADKGSVAFPWTPEQWKANRFTVLGAEEDVEAFWNNVGELQQSGPVIPAAFVYTAALRQSMVLVQIHVDRVDPDYLRHLDALSAVLRTRDLGTMILIIFRFSADSLYAPEYSDAAESPCASVAADQVGGLRSDTQPVYSDSVRWTFIPACKETT